jgi:predicted RNase H-like nuclease
MSPKQLFKVAGVDGCKSGWLVAIVKVKGKKYEIDKKPFVEKIFRKVKRKTKSCKVVCVDIPIGLSDGYESRMCDIVARRILGKPRGSSVFEAPIRPCLCYYRRNQYKKANKISKNLGGRGLSKQSFNIMDKIRQVDHVMNRPPKKQKCFREVHPEVCFWALNHRKPMKNRKSSKGGRKERIRVLAPIFQNLRGIVTKDNRPRGVKVDDILDALVAAYTAAQVAIGKAGKLPEKPPLDSKGLKMEMLYPICYNQ